MFEIAQVVADTVAHMEKLRRDPVASKGDVCDDVRERLAVIMSKLVSYPVVSNFALPYVDIDYNVSNNQELNDYFEDQENSEASCETQEDM